MISLNILAEKIQEKLNIVQGLNFNVIVDTADLKTPERKGNEVIEYINGVLSSSNSEVTKLTAGADKSLIYATQTCNLNLIVPIPNFEKNVYILSDGTSVEGELGELEDGITVVEYAQGYAEKLANIRSVLQTVLQGIDVEEIKDDEGMIYSVTTAYSFSQGGSRSQQAMLGDCFTYFITVYYSFVQNGLNSRNMTFMLDGILLPAQLLTVFRIPTMDGNVYSNTKDGAVKNISSQSSFSATISMPAFNEDEATAYILDYVLNGNLNQAHLLTYTQGNQSQSYIVTYGENKIMGETIKNIGQEITLVECPDIYELISFGDNYSVYSAQSTTCTFRPKKGAQTYHFGNGMWYNDYPGENSTFSASGATDDKIVSTQPLESSTNLQKL